jgi:hypothetical protein
MNWFVFNWKLYQYRDGDFYLSEGVRMSASDDDAVEAYHRERFRTTQRQGNNGYWNGQTNNPLQQNPDALSTFTYRNQKYQIKQGFLSEDGMIINGSRWRYYQNTWKKSNDNSAPYDNWMATNQADIDYLLSKIATKIQSGQTRTEQTRTGQTAQENPPAGADDQYWIDLVPRRNSLNGDNLCEAKSNLLIKTSLSREGKAAFIKVKKAIETKNCSF